LIKINLLDPKKQELNDAVAQFLEIRRNGSYSERRPELGKMINCAVCGRRHRSAHVCVPIYGRTLGHINEKDELVPDTKRQANGAAAYKGRILKHRNAWGLQVLERTLSIFRKRDDLRCMWWMLDDLSDNDLAEMKRLRGEYEDKLGRQSLSRALNEKRAERALRRKKLLTITKRSRRINQEAR
jgi:hypothetical protein